MKILIIDVYSGLLDFALRCLDAGHEVKWFQSRLKDGSPSMVGNGLVKKVGRWEEHMRWADLIVLADNVRYLPALESWRKQGYPIFGPSWNASQWELNRIVGQQVFRSHGIKTIDSIEFKYIKDAQRFLLKNPGRYVSKPNADDNKALSYVSKSARDMMFMLEKWAKSGQVKTDFIFQKFVPGIEVAVGGWMGRDGFVGPWLENFEHKKLMNDDVGCNTGESGTVLRYTTESALADRVLAPIEPELIRQGYTGYIDVSVMVTRSGDPLPLEWTCRPGYPLQQILQCLHVGDPALWMHDALLGMDTVTVTDEIATGVVIAMPDYPFCNIPKREQAGYPVYGWGAIPSKHFHPCEMMAGNVWDDNLKKVPGLVTAGEYVCVVTGSGKTVEKSHEAAYRNVGRLEIPNSPMYRTDIGCRVMDQLETLQALGFCESWKA